MRIGTLGLATVSALVACLFSSAQATPIAGSMSTTAHVALGQNNNQDPQTDSWSGVPTSLSLAVNASLTDPASGASVTASGSSSATWSPDGNSGSVQFTDYGWTTASGSDNYEADFFTGGPDWFYSFMADADGTFTLNYNVVGSGSTFGLQGWDLCFLPDLSCGLVATNVNDPTGSGIFTAPVLAGQSYVVSLYNLANVSSGGAFDAGSMSGTFDFSISADAVPEPGTLGLLGAGLAGLAALRRRRKDARKIA